ncbi:MAG TPA: HEAT repeat domain-containing protein, partial [Thermoanaerobaculia bacterium]
IEGQETRIVVEAPVAPDFQEVSILPQSGSAMWDVTIGDPGFDGQFAIKGPRRQVFALLDADTRGRMRAVNAAGRLEISPGRILAIVGTDRVSDALPSLLAIRKRLATPIDVRRSLVENARRDSESGVRLENLLVLIQELPGDPATVEALRAACSDRLPTIRLRAAKELGAAESRDVLLELANGLEDDAWSAEAVSILDRELPVERVKALLDRAWSTGRLQTALACVEVLGHSGAAAVEPLSELLALQNAELAAAAATALGATDSPAAEPWLIPALQSEHEVLRVAAAKALRRVGSVAAVLPLKEAHERSSWLDIDFRQVTRQAMAEIQSRVQGGSPGQLSLTEEAGQLSLAEDPAGQLSLPPEERPD